LNTVKPVLRGQEKVA